MKLFIFFKKYFRYFFVTCIFVCIIFSSFSVSATDKVLSFDLWKGGTFTMYYIDHGNNVLNNTVPEVSMIRKTGYTYFQNYEPFLIDYYNLQGLRAIRLISKSVEPSFTLGAIAGYKGYFNIRVTFEGNSNLGYFDSTNFQNTAYVRFFTNSAQTSYATAKCISVSQSSDPQRLTADLTFELDLSSYTSSTSFYGFLIFIPVQSYWTTMDPDYILDFSTYFECFDCIISDELTKEQLQEVLDENTDKLIEGINPGGYEPPDTSSMDAYFDKESALMDAANVLKNQNDVSFDLGFIFDDAMIYNSWTCASALLTEFFSSSKFFRILLRVSLMLGAFSLVIGLSRSFISSSRK